VADAIIPAIPGTGNMKTVQWFYEPNSPLGIPEGLELRFQSQPGMGSWLEPSDGVEDALERVRKSYIANPGAAYALDSRGRLKKPPSRFDPRSRAKKVLREMIAGDTLPADISFDTEIAFFRAKDGCYVPLLIQIEREHLRWDNQVAQVAAFVSIESVDGRLLSYFEEPLALTFPQAGPSVLELPFQLPSGNYTFSLGVLDENSKLAGTRRIPVFVPDFYTEELDLSSVLLYTDKSISDEAPAALGRAFQFGNAHFEPIGRRPLRPTDNLGVFFFVYGFDLDDGGEPHLTADYILIGDGEPGEPIDGPPIHADPLQAYADQEISLAGFEPGRYQVEIQVTDHISNRVVKKRVDFVVEIETRLVAEYSELVSQYQNGRFDTVADAMSRVPRASIPGAAKAYRMGSRRDSDLKAAAILHTEVAVAMGIVDRAHLKAAREYLEEIEDESHRRIVKRLHYLAVAYHLRRSPESFGAISILEDALGAFPRDIELRLAVASVYEMVGWLGSRQYLEQAEGLFRGVVEEEPSHAEAHLRLGRVLQLKGEREDAIRELKRSLECSDDLETGFIAHMLLGGLYCGRGQLTEAVRSYRAALGIDPACQSCTIALSYTLEQIGDPEGSHQVIAELLGRSLELSEKTDRWRSFVRGDSEKVESVLAQLREHVLP
jgi:tetratricopeptide (TPR) repeat protein